MELKSDIFFRVLATLIVLGLWYLGILGLQKNFFLSSNVNKENENSAINSKPATPINPPSNSSITQEISANPTIEKNKIVSSEIVKTETTLQTQIPVNTQTQKTAQTSANLETPEIAKPTSEVVKSVPKVVQPTPEIAKPTSEVAKSAPEVVQPTPEIAKPAYIVHPVQIPAEVLENLQNMKNTSWLPKDMRIANNLCSLISPNLFCLIPSTNYGIWVNNILTNNISLQLWDMEKGLPLANIPTSHTKPIQHLAFSSHHFGIISISESGEISLWKMKDQKSNIIANLKDKNIYSLTTEQSNIDEKSLLEKKIIAIESFYMQPYLAIANTNNQIEILNLEENKITSQIHVNRPILQIRILPNNTQILVNMKEQPLELWDIANNRSIKNYPQIPNEKIEISHTGQYCLSCKNTDWAFWEITSGKIIQEGKLELEILSQSNLLFSQDMKYAAGITKSGNFYSWNIISKEPKSMLPGTYKQIWLQQQKCVMVNKDGYIQTVLLNDGELSNEKLYHITAYTYSNDGKYFAIGYHTGQIKIFEENGNLWKTLGSAKKDDGIDEDVGHFVAISDMQFSENGYLLSGDIGGKLIQWELKTASEYQTQKLSDAIQCVAISKNAKYLLASVGNSAYIYSDEKNQPSLLSCRGTFLSLAISLPQAKIYALAQEQKETVLYTSEIRNEQKRKTPFLGYPILVLQGNNEILIESQK